MIRKLNPSRAKIFSILSTVTGLAVGFTSLLFSGNKVFFSQGAKLTTYFHIVPTGATPLPPPPSRSGV
jgi:hypothetical protein